MGTLPLCTEMPTPFNWAVANPLYAYGIPYFLFDTVYSQYKNGLNVTTSFSTATLTGLTFTRNTPTAYAPNSAGTLIAFAANVPRITDRGLLIEGARTNLLTYSQDYSNAAWSKTGTTVTSANNPAPDGTNTATLLTTTGSDVLSSSGTVSSGATATLSVCLKRGDYDWVRLTILSGGNEIRGWFNLATGAVGTQNTAGTGSAAGISIRALADGYYICAIAGSVAAATSYVCVVASANGDGSFTRVNGTRYQWYSQLEQAAFPSSCIPTTSASVTRPADVCSIAVSGIGYPATLFAEFERVVDTGGAEGLMCAFGSAGEFSEIMISSTDVARQVVQNGGVSSVDQTAGSAYALATTGRMAARVATNDSRIQGLSAGATDTSATLPTSPATILLGTRSGGGSPSFGYIKRAAVWTSAFTDAQLTAVSS